MVLTYKQALFAAYTMLDDLHDQTQSKLLFSLLRDMNPFVFTDRTPADPATWSEWIACAEKVQNEGILTADKVYQTLVSFLRYNEGQYGYVTDEILEDLQTPSRKKRWTQLLMRAASLEDE